MDRLLILSIRLSHGYVGDLLVRRVAKTLEIAFSICFCKVLFDLHNHIVAGHQRRNSLQYASHTQIVHGSQAIVEPWLIIGVFPASCLRFEEPALASPLNNFPITKFYVVWMLLHEHIEPVEGAL